MTTLPAFFTTKGTTYKTTYILCKDRVIEVTRPAAMQQQLYIPPSDSFINLNSTSISVPYNYTPVTGPMEMTEDEQKLIEEELGHEFKNNVKLTINGLDTDSIPEITIQKL